MILIQKLQESSSQTESNVLDSFATLFGLDEVFHNHSRKGASVIQSSSLNAALLALSAARTRFLSAFPNISMDSLVLYVSEHSRLLGVKTAKLLGVRHRVIPVTREDEFCLRGEAILEAVREDSRLNRAPFALCEWYLSVPVWSRVLCEIKW